MKALVTGGCHGIGLAIVNELKAQGHEVIDICRHKGYDLSVDKHYLRACDLMYDRDILINNVGGGGRWKEDDWRMVFQKNVEPMVGLTRCAIDRMLKQQWGRIITIASVYGKEAGGHPGFAGAKAYQIAWMKTMSLNPEYQKANITFNVVCPGPIWIEGKEQDKYETYGQPEDVAGIVGFLCTDKARWINGAVITVDGGFSRSF